MASTAPLAQPISFGDTVQGTITSLTANGIAEGYSKHITCNPTKTHFPHQSFHRHTHFALAHINLPVKNKPAPNFLWPDNHLVEADVDRAGDLIGKIMFCTRYNRLTSEAAATQTVTGMAVGAVNHFAFAQILNTTLEIGSQVIESHSGEALFVMDQLGYNGKDVDMSHSHASYATNLGAEADSIAVSNTIPHELQLRVAEISEYAVNLQFHCGRGNDAEDLAKMMWPNLSVQRQKLKITTALRKKIGLLKSYGSSGLNHDTEDELTTILTNATAAGIGKFELLDMYYSLQAVYLDPQERMKRAHQDNNRIIKYVKQLAATRFNAGDSHLEIKLDSDQNTSDYIIFARRDNASHYSAKDYFDFSVHVNDGLVPNDLSSASATTVYWPRNPLQHLRLKANNNVQVDATAQHLHQITPLFHHYNNVPTQFICVISKSLNPHVQSEDWGSQADSKIDNLVLEVDLAKTNTAATGIAYAGTVYVLSTKCSRIKVSGGQVGIEFPTH